MSKKIPQLISILSLIILSLLFQTGITNAAPTITEYNSGDQSFINNAGSNFVFTSTKELVYPAEDSKLVYFKLSDHTYREVEIPPIDSDPGTRHLLGLAVDSGNNIWFSRGEHGEDVNTAKYYISKISPSGVISNYPYSMNNQAIFGLTFKPNGELWAYGGSWHQNTSPAAFIAKLNPANAQVIDIYPVDMEIVYDATSLANGSLLFNGVAYNENGKTVGTVGSSGDVQTYATSSSISGRAAQDSSNNIWAAGNLPNTLSKITPDGEISQFQISDIYITSILLGSNNSLYFGSVSINTSNGTANQSSIGKLNQDGTYTLYPMPTSTNIPVYLANGPDGNIWALIYKFNGTDLKLGLAKITPEPTSTTTTINSAKTISAPKTGSLSVVIIATSLVIAYLALVWKLHHNRINQKKVSSK